MSMDKNLSSVLEDAFSGVFQEKVSFITSDISIPDFIMLLKLDKEGGEILKFCSEDFDEFLMEVQQVNLLGSIDRRFIIDLNDVDSSKKIKKLNNIESPYSIYCCDPEGVLDKKKFIHVKCPTKKSSWGPILKILAGYYGVDLTKDAEEYFFRECSFSRWITELSKFSLSNSRVDRKIIAALGSIEESQLIEMKILEACLSRNELEIVRLLSDFLGSGDPIRILRFLQKRISELLVVMSVTLRTGAKAHEISGKTGIPFFSVKVMHAACQKFKPVEVIKILDFLVFLEWRLKTGSSESILPLSLAYVFSNRR